MYIYITERAQMNTPLKYIHTHTHTQRWKILTNTVAALCDHFSLSPLFLILSEDVVSAGSHCEALAPIFDLGFVFFFLHTEVTKGYRKSRWT